MLKEAWVSDKTFIGVDVSAEWIDIAFHGRGAVERIANEAEAIAATAVYGRLVVVEGVRLLRTGRPIAVVLVVLATTFLCAFPALWVVLLGPALLILMSGQPS